MGADVVIAICATIIALASLWVSYSQSKATRIHNRQSVRPVLELRAGFRQGHTAGLQLVNVGLGPAAIVKTILKLDDQVLGEYSEVTVNKVRDTLVNIRPAAVTFGCEAILATNYSYFLLSVDGYDRDVHAKFAELIRKRLSLEIYYDSLYGGEGFRIGWPT